MKKTIASFIYVLTVLPCQARVITVALMMGLLLAATAYADPNLTWGRAAYWDTRYPSCFTQGVFIRDGLDYAGYEILDADQLKIWMDARIADGAPSVVVFCQDIVPDTVAESMSPTCTLRQYLDAGGKVVWYADTPLWQQGHADGTTTVWDSSGSINVLGFHASDGPSDSWDEVTFTAEGVEWGLTETWQSTRPVTTDGVRVLAVDDSGYAAGWVKHYVAQDTYRGFVRVYDCPGEPNINDIRRVAEYPLVPEWIDPDNKQERQDDIICAYYYGWYGDADKSGWAGMNGWSTTIWPSHYIPNYPDGTWDPNIQLYYSADPDVLRWQDRAMARAGIDVAIVNWARIGDRTDEAFSKAIRICKSVQWCLGYEMEGYEDPTVQRIYDEVKYILDNYGPARNYAKIDGKWLIVVNGADEQDAASRWSEAKDMLAASGYCVYLNGQGGQGEPWDAATVYDPVNRQGLTETTPNIDDTAWISPGFWLYSEDTYELEHSLSEFTSAWNNIVANRRRSRFIVIETWNEWYEGTQIEPGQQIVQDPNGYYPAGYDYGYDFIDAIAPTAVNELRWESSGHRPDIPVRLEAEEMVWELGTSAQGSSAWRINEDGARIGGSVLLLGNDLRLTVRARAVKVGGSAGWPTLVLYLDDVPVGQWVVDSLTYQNYSAVTVTSSGVHKVEAALANDPGGAEDVDLVVDFLVCTGLEAGCPTPADGACGVSTDVVLRWTAGARADSHDVYLGTDRNEVNDANTTLTSGVYKGRQDPCSFDPCGLETDTKYYWRIDEVNDYDGNTPCKGKVWSFTTSKIVYVPPEYPTIQAAIDSAWDGVTIVVDVGTYEENINLKGKNLTVRSAEPNDAAVVAAAIIRGNKYAPIVTFSSSEDGNCVLAGLTITDGNEGVYCAGASPTIRNCRIVGNQDSGIELWPVAGWRKSPTIIGCTIADNEGAGIKTRGRTRLTIIGCIIAGNNSAGLDSEGGTTITNCIISENLRHGILGDFATISNCTIVGNLPSGFSGYDGSITNSILWDNSPHQVVDLWATAAVSYSTVEGGWPGLGNIDANPCFAEPGRWVDADDPNIVVEPNDPNAVWIDGDYHLKSEGWYWNTTADQWDWDEVTSRCIDAGNPGAPLGDEALTLDVDPLNRFGQNLRINMGAYGGTAEASMPPYHWALLADLNNDGTVSFVDVGHYAQYWLDAGSELPADLDRDGTVDLTDYALLGQDYFLHTSWYE
ncbi:MAG: right-handed parallel beta-helix repeat-containing protein [Planctomycetota bacterium]